MTCCAMLGLGQFRVNCRNPLYNSRMSALYTVPLALVLTTLGVTPRNIAFPTEDGGRVCADLYGQGTRAVVLAHGRGSRTVAAA